MKTSFLYKGLKTLFVLLVFQFLHTSCAGSIGYGVVNWVIPEYNLSVGDIIPIYVKSNIEKVYIVGLNEQTSLRVEIPLWQLTFFKSKKEALNFKAKISEFMHTYATVKLDGLPMRKYADISSEQIYRLKEGQTVKILWAGEGVPVLRNGTPIEGKWFSVLTKDGVKGWCFSHNLNIYDVRNKAASNITSADEEIDTQLEEVLNQTWYPENYRKMINAKQINLNKMAVTWGFYPGVRAGVARIELEKIKLSFPYTKIIKLGTKYQFEGTGLLMQIQSEDTISLEFSDKNGKRRIENFIKLALPIEEIIENEKERQNEIIAKITKSSQSFFSENFGSLKILPEGQFIWTGYAIISPSIIPAGAGSKGKIDTQYFIDKKFNSNYEGVLSFKFDKLKEPIIFMYNISAKGLHLEAVNSENVIDGLVKRRSLNPVILFFASNS